MLCRDPDTLSEIFGLFVLGAMVCVERGGQDPAGLRAAVAAFREYVAFEFNADGGTSILAQLRPRGVLERERISKLALELFFDFTLFDILDDLERPPKVVLQVLTMPWAPLHVQKKMVAFSVRSAIKMRVSVLPRGARFMQLFHNCSAEFAPVTGAGVLGFGDPAYVEMIEKITDVLVDYARECFAAASDANSPETYAADLVAVTRRYTTQMLQLSEVCYARQQANGSAHHAPSVGQSGLAHPIAGHGTRSEV